MIKILTDRLILKAPQLEAAPLLKEFHWRNQEHLRKWESLDHLSSLDKDYGALLKEWRRQEEEGRALRFLLFLKEKPEILIGQCNFTQIFYGAFQACYLGYKIDVAYQGRGLMFEALQKSIAHLFETVQLHRIMANYMPANIRSARLLKRLGFSIEGYAQNYLRINNRWEDHVLTALTYEQWQNR